LPAAVTALDPVLAKSERIGREELRRLLARRNAPGLVRFGVQLVLLVASAAATLRLVAAGHPAWIGSVVLCGVVLATFFPPLHEAGHRTAFRSERLNDAVAWIGAVLMLQAPSFFREFHWEHHRQTQNPERDPEIAPAPGLVDGWPRNPLTYLAVASGQHLMLGKLGFTLSSAVMPAARAWERLFPFVRPDLRARIAWESRLVALLLAAVLLVGLSFVPGFSQLLLAWPIAHVVLGLYLMPEHTGLPHDGTQLERTRSVRTNALVRWFMWNMPNHAEHHAYPGVPVHAVPGLHLLLAPELEHVSPGYLDFHAEALRRALGRA
jgi:fatty acid desaturase